MTQTYQQHLPHSFTSIEAHDFKETSKFSTTLTGSLKMCKNVMVIVGAGISVNSGIPVCSYLFCVSIFLLSRILDLLAVYTT